VRVVLLRNSKSGKGHAPALSARAAASLRQAGHEPDEIEIGAPDLPSRLEGAGAVVIVGGDGTVHHGLRLLTSIDVPIWLVPTGTENLLARELGMRVSPERVGEMVSTGVRRRIDVARASAGGSGGCGGAGGVERLFVIMLSVGPDASVIHRLDAMRTGPISHASYLRPVLHEWRSPALPRLTVDVDARRLVTDQRGLLIVANSRQYALRADPAAEADVADGRLDIVFFPCRSAFGAAGWLVRSRLHRALRHRRAVRARGVDVRIALGLGEPAGGALPVQMDGEAISMGPGPISVSVLPGALSTLAGGRAG